MKPELKTEHALEYSKTSKELTSSLSKKEKKDNGIYFTPPSCVRKNIELLKKYLPEEIKEDFTILEPSCGSGEYIKALCEDDMFSLCKITGVEINKTIFDAIKKLHDTNMNITLLNSDFLKYSCDSTYNLILGNPPYFVLKKEDVVSEYNKFYDGRPNIFILFVVKCLGMLANGGILSFVLPKSFLNCLYYDKTRKYINDNFMILDIVECSDDKYIETAQ
jgi:type I restriction-modification system DNA methylase subunit